MNKGIQLWNKAKKIIPGGSQLLSKRTEMILPELWPSYYKKAKGIEVWDLEDKKYIDMFYMGIGSCILGYADDDVHKAVKQVVDDGSMTTLNAPEEVELAELLCELHPWASKVRYARTGGEAMAIAVRIARAYSGKDQVAFCGYHGWHDWYLSSNLADDKNLDGHLLPGLEPKGVPRGLKGTAIPFHYNKIQELEDIIKNNDIGVIVMEPMRHQEPKDGFLEKVRTIADEHNIVLIFDEITIGWRMNLGGIHLTLGVEPDIAVFAKAISNGYPMAAIIGKDKVMEASQSSFISSTYWTERIGPVAALATIKKMEKENLSEHLEKMGQLIKNGWQELSKKHGLDITIQGPLPLITYAWNYKDKNQALATLFTQEMLKKGYLASKSVYLSLAHKSNDIEQYLKAVDQVFALISKAIQQNNINDLLEGPPVHTSFQRLT